MNVQPNAWESLREERKALLALAREACADSRNHRQVAVWRRAIRQRTALERRGAARKVPALISIHRGASRDGRVDHP